MWDNYANGHTGVCFEYDTSKLFKLNGCFYKVCYDEHEYSEYDANLDFNERLGKVLVNSILTKNKDYEYEREWRHFAILKNKTHISTGEALTRIYLGSNMSENDCNKIMEGYDGDAEIIQLKVCPDKYIFEQKKLR